MPDTKDLTVRFSEEPPRGRFELVDADGRRWAELTFSRTHPDQVIADHTEVDDALRGKNAGKRLFDALVAWARETHTRVIPLCPFVKRMFERDEDARDVLAP